MKANQQNVSKIEIVGRLLTQDISKQNLVVLSEECSANILDLSQPGTPFNYTLYMNNQDQNEKSQWNHLTFEIKPSMELSIFTNMDIDVIQWFTKNSIYFFEILVDERNEKNKNNFWKALEQCLYSVSNKIPLEQAALKCQRSSEHYIKNLGPINNLENHVKYLLTILKKQRQQEEVNKGLVQQMKNLNIELPRLEKIINIQVAKKIFEAKGELYNYDINKDDLVNLNNKQKLILRVYRLDSQKFDYILTIETMDSNPYLLSIDKITENISGQMIKNNDTQCFCWITTKVFINIIGNCLGFLFDELSSSEKFNIIYEKCKYENKTGEEYETIEEKNRKYLENARNYTNMDCFSDDEDEEEKEEEEIKPKKKKMQKKKKKNREELYDIDDEYNEAESNNNKNVINKFCVDALSNDRTFCVNDNNEIVVYRSNLNNDTIEKLASLPVVQEYEGKDVVLNKGLLYKSEQNMLLLDQNNPYVLYQFDLPKGKIVSEWKTDNTSIADICSLKRNGQTTDEKLIYGVNNKAIFTLDERMNNRNNIGDIKTYQQNNHANKIISTGDGQFVTGGEKGELRFYDRIGVKAKNLLTFYGDPIRHIEISSDDQYILITCDKYLLLFNTTDKEGEESSFLKTIKLENRRKPVTLKLNTKDIAKYDLQDKCFTPARFDLNENGVNNIITSLGEYIIIWNYNDIRKKRMNYKIQKAGDLVIDNYFKVGQGNKIIVGMPTKVRIQNLKKRK